MAGSQRLTELRDALQCPADMNLRTLGLAVPSAYFYIEGTFYNDRRSPDSLEYSQQIIRFCGDNNLPPPPGPGPDSAEASFLPQEEPHTGTAHFSHRLPNFYVNVMGLTLLCPTGAQLTCCNVQTCLAL